MSDQRKNIRFKTLAKVNIMEPANSAADSGAKAACEIYLKDISVIGCRVECTKHAGIEINRKYRLEVIPENDSNVDPFDLLVETKWVRAEAIGFSIMESPKGKLFQNYVDYLSWRGAQEIPESPEISGIPRIPGS